MGGALGAAVVTRGAGWVGGGVGSGAGEGAESLGWGGAGAGGASGACGADRACVTRRLDGTVGAIGAGVAHGRGRCTWITSGWIGATEVGSEREAWLLAASAMVLVSAAAVAQLRPNTSRRLTPAACPRLERFEVRRSGRSEEPSVILVFLVLLVLGVFGVLGVGLVSVLRLV